MPGANAAGETETTSFDGVGPCPLTVSQEAPDETEGLKFSGGVAAMLRVCEGGRLPCCV